MTKSMTKSMTESMPKSMTESMPKSMTESMTKSMTESMTKSMTESIFSNNSVHFFKNIDNLPKDLTLIVSSYIPNIAKMCLNKELYAKYHYLFRECINRLKLETYIRTTVRQDSYFVFNQLLQENYNKWLSIKKYLYQDCIYANYIYFLKTYCVENQSIKCKELINNLIEELGLSKNQHKKNIIRNIRWNH